MELDCCNPITHQDTAKRTASPIVRYTSLLIEHSMKIPAKILLPLFFSLISMSSYGDIYAQFGYEEGQDGVLLLTEKCSGSAGDAGFKMAFIRVDGSVMQGCYVKNNRGNFIAKWQDGSIDEFPSNRFTVKVSTPNISGNPKSEINWDETKPLYIYVDGENQCFKSEYGMLSSPWGNYESPEESRVVANDQRSMTLIGKFKDGQSVKVNHYLSMDECQSGLEKN